MLERLILRADPCLLVAAHPDDETLSAGAILPRLRHVSVVHVTDGAPRDRRFFPPGIDLSRERYAALRREEVLAALAFAGVPADRVHRLGAVDQEAIHDLPRLVEALVQLILEADPALLITHPYEGGHPDHDAAAFSAHMAVAVLRRAGHRVPLLFEAASYHGAGGRFTPGEFLPAPDRPEARFELSAEDLVRKRAMLACFASQREVIAAFPLRDERLRAAPEYDFTRPPHEGPTHYERLGWPMSGQDFRARAKACLTALHLEVSPCL
jgi:LmbE family N-acetylglucosaminyl deacetylase